MKEYNANIIEKKWQDIWEEKGSFIAHDDSDKPKRYLLIEFPYPSAKGLHVGHARPFTAMDVVARKSRLEGYNVLYPIGFDAFGLPTENYAIKHKVKPRTATDEAISNFRKQLKSLGFSFDWDREIDTTDDGYVKWTQYLFLKFLEHGLAYKDTLSINWCPSCKIGLANEEVVNGRCERCHGEVYKRDKEQWMLKITAYAQRLIDDLKDLDYIPRAKSQQIHWIGRSEGAEIDFPIGKDHSYKVRIFTTRPDTIYGATYMVVAPEHPMIQELASEITNMGELDEYRENAKKKSDLERTELSKEKTGIEIKGLKAFNPISEKEIPVFISDYVMMTYGTGAIMAVPAHDQRDYEFAKKFGQEIIPVIEGGDIEKEAFVGDGKVINSPLINGLTVKDAIAKMIAIIGERGLGTSKINYKLRDWVFSRQRYWGEPIPVVHCPDCGTVPLPYEELPLTLPDLDSYQPSDDGESPLSKVEEWVNTTCPKCGGKAKRETDTMPNWAGSSWYFLRYTDPHNDKEFASKEKLEKWMSVDWYNGGMEHTTLHLLYSRFWHKFLYDIGLVTTPEPYKKRTSHGMILGEGGVKMSKSLGNVVNPDDIINEHGADTLRLYEMFIGDFEQAATWSDDSLRGCRRFLDRIWKLQTMLNIGDKAVDPGLEVEYNNMIKKVTEDFENLKYNTAIASMMAFTNSIYQKGSISEPEFRTLLLLLNPLCPHITSELWELSFGGDIADESWPTYDPEKLLADSIEIAVQINGKLRATISVPREASSEECEKIAFANDKVIEFLEGKNVVKTIVIPAKIVNIVVK